jgi:transcriptional regulator with XRE-family HTH domain
MKRDQSKTTEKAADLNRLGRQFRARRKQKGLSQVALGRLAQVQQSEISRLERGNENISMTGVFRILDVLDAKLGFFNKEDCLVLTL